MFIILTTGQDFKATPIASSRQQGDAMIPRRTVTSFSLAFPLLLAFGGSALAQEHAVAPRCSQQEKVIAGSPKDSLEVRHLTLSGTNEEIGRALAQLAQQRYQVRLQPSVDPARTRAQRRYIERNDPILYERMKGVASAFGQRVDDDAWQHTGLGFVDLRAGCSIVHLPPRTTANGKSVVSRDYDYSTGSISFGFLSPGQLH